jgi:molybdopterin molybdotransferase
MLELEVALDRILALLPAPELERIPLHAAHRRVLAENKVSAVDLPGFDNSAVDGYAVRSQDVQKATGASPVMLRLAGRVAAGESFKGELAGGSSVRLFTGAPLPRGADAVVMQEDTWTSAEVPDAVQILDGVKPWENIRFRGGDLKKGAAVAGAGDALTAARIQLLAATGSSEILVGRKPVTALLATGSELVEPGQPITDAKIHESNRLGLAALVNRAGGVPKIMPLVKDVLADTRAALDTAFQESDIVITSGGVSVGETDFVKSAFQALGGELQFWKVAIRPGRPFAFGRLHNKLLFGLPGNPVSAFVTFLLLVRPAIARWQGARDIALPSHLATLAEPFANQGNRRHFLRVIVDGLGNVRSAGSQESHLLGSLAAANALLDLAPGMTLAAGDAVKVMRWE